MKLSRTLKTLCCASLAALLFASCSDSGSSDDSTSDPNAIDYTTPKADYGTTYSIEPSVDADEDGVITITNNTETEVTYTISGYFKGQIHVTGEDVQIALKNAYLENEGAPVILADLSTDISFKKDTVNYIVETGTTEEKTGAIFSDSKKIKIGGKGTGYIVGNITNAIKADKVEFKGEGIYKLQGTSDGSAVNCNEFSVEADRTFTAYLLCSKNGIKADETITINSGTFNFINNKTALKTDTKEDDGADIHAITINGGTFTLSGNKTDCSTDTLENNASNWTSDND